MQKEWYDKSNHLVLLSCENEQVLKQLLDKAKSKSILCSAFTEPDMGDELTAVAFEPSEDTCKLVSSLPLAFKEYKIHFNVKDREVTCGN